MPQSLCQIYLHIIFAAKDHRRWLDETIRSRVHAYLATLARDCGCPYVHVGGPGDHIHMLVDIGKQVASVDLIGKVKQDSSRFVKGFGTEYEHFYWQGGYGAFSVGPTRVNEVEAYIDNQVEHHKRLTFKDEFKAFLDKYEIDYDERFVWD